jgi:putative transposase
MKAIHHRTVVFKIGYQVVFCTKYRRKVLAGEVDEYLKTVLMEIASKKGFEIATMETGPDYVQLFVSAAPHVPVSQIVKWVKGISALRLLRKFLTLKTRMGSHLWNPSYYVGTVGDMSAEDVRLYIEYQKQEA